MQAMTDNTRFQEFVNNRAARSQITFGDIRRLQRDYLPDGVSTRAEAEMLIRLDGAVERADKAWADWLVTTILDFLDTDEPCDAADSAPHAWLKSVLADAGATTKAARKIAREIRAERAKEPVTFTVIEESVNAPAAFPIPIENQPLELAA
jgi:hypothetical protein